MSYSISTLLTRNLDDVFGENDPARRSAAIDEIFTEDCLFYEPKGVYRGRDEIDRVAGAIKATHSDFRYQPIAPPEELGDGGRIRWVSGRRGEAPAYAGTDSSLPGRPDCRHLSVFRQATLSWILRCHGTAKEWNAHSERSSWESGADRLVDFSRPARQSERTFGHDRNNFSATF
jgi:hypothetical protein